MTTRFTSKYSYEAYGISFNFTNDLGAETIVSASITASDMADSSDATATILDDTKQSNSNTVVYGWVMAGTTGHEYLITCQIVGSAGSQYELEGILPILGAGPAPGIKTLADILSRLRISYLDDNVVPYKWSNTELIRNLNLAQEEFCWRKNELVERDLPIALTTTTNVVDLTTVKDGFLIRPTFVLALRRDGTPLVSVSRKLLEMQSPTWSQATGQPEGFYVEDSNLVIVPAANTTYNLTLDVARLPLEDMALESNTSAAVDLEINEVYVEKLFDWACHLAYLKQDSDTYDAAKAKAYEEDFTRKVGPRRSAKLEAFLQMAGGDIHRMRAQKFGG